MIELGKKARDKITGFTGVVTGRSQWITGCDQYCLAPEADKKGRLEDSRWFDEGRLEIIGDGVEASELAIKGNKPGGPKSDAPPTR